MLVAKRYELYEKLGEGGMGTVYRAIDRLNKQPVALKRVFRPPAQLLFSSRKTIDPTEVDLRLALMREFQMLASLRHPYIIPVLDYGFDEQQQPFFTMFLLDHSQTILDVAKTCSLEDQVKLLVQLLQALEYLHRHSVLHRDLKPSNILVAGNSEVKLLDFGLAVERGRAAGIVGTVMYMAPEILKGENATERSDLFAVGVIAYEMLAGRHPFDIGLLSRLITSLLQDDVDTSPLPEPIRAVIQILLAKDPTQRYADASTVIEALYGITSKPVYIEPKAIRESFLQAAPFVGRVAELHQLEGALREASGGRGRALLIAGESGVGKSRLLHEIRIRALVNDMLVLHGQAVEGGGLPYQLWRTVLPRLIIAGDLSPKEAKLLRLIVPDIADLTGHPLEDNSPPANADPGRIAQTIEALFRRYQQPALLLLEDLQWSEESLDPLRQLAKTVDTLPLLIVATYRSDDRPDLPKWLPDMSLILLNRFTETETQQLTELMTGKGGSSPNVHRLLHQETEGNALFLVEAVRMLAEEAGRLQYIGRGPLPERIVTGGIRYLLQRRLSRIPDWGQELLKLAAVAGRRLDMALLRQTAHLPLQGLEAWLTACAGAAVLEIQDGIWQFSHDKLRETLLEELDEVQHRALHLQIATSLEQAYPERPDYAAILADHWRLAHDTTKEQHYREIAGMFTLRTSVYKQALGHFERLLELATTPKEKLKWNNEVARVLTRLNDLDAAERIYQEAIDLAVQLVEPAGEAIALHGLASIANTKGHHQAAIENLVRCLEINRRLGKRPLEGYNLQELGRSYNSIGRYEQGIDLIEQGVAIALELGDQHSAGIGLNNIGDAYRMWGNIQHARHYFEQALTIARETGHRRGEATRTMNLAICEQMLGHYDAAKSYLDTALNIHVSMENRQGEMEVLERLGVQAMSLGDFETARACFQQSLDISSHIKLPWIESIFAFTTLLILLNDNEQALVYGNQAFDLIIETGQDAFKGAVAAAYAWALLRNGDNTSALKILETVALQDKGQSGPASATTLGIIRMRCGENASEAFNLGIERAEALIAATPENHEAWYMLGLAQAGLVLVNGTPVDEAQATYKTALAITSAKGVRYAAIARLSELGSADKLASIFSLLRQEA